MRNAEQAGAVGAVIVDNAEQTTSGVLAMSGDGTDDVNIPSLFLNQVYIGHNEVHYTTSSLILITSLITLYTTLLLITVFLAGLITSSLKGTYDGSKYGRLVR